MPIWSGRVLTSEDDCRAFLPESLDVAPPVIAFGSNPFGIIFSGGVRFVGLPTDLQEAVINSAVMSIIAESDSDPTVANVRFQGELAVDPQPFSTYDDFMGRLRTSAYVEWSGIPAFVADVEYQIDVTPLIQEIAALGPGSSLAVLWESFASEFGSQRRAWAFDGDPARATVLTIDYTPPVIPTYALTVTALEDSTPLPGITFLFGENMVELTTPVTILDLIGNVPVNMPTQFVHPVTGETLIFLGWSDGFTNPNRIVPMTSDTLITAIFYIEEPLTFNLTVSASVGGTTNPMPGIYAYAQGDVATVQAIPSPGYYFDYWLLDGLNVGVVNPIGMTMDIDHALQAVFTPEAVPEYSLTVNALEDSTPLPGIIFTAFEGENMVEYPTPTTITGIPENTQVTVTMPTQFIHPVSGLTLIFLRWTDGNTNPSRINNMTNDTLITAIFYVEGEEPPEPSLLPSAIAIAAGLGLIYLGSRK